MTTPPRVARESNDRLIRKTFLGPEP